MRRHILPAVALAALFAAVVTLAAKGPADELAVRHVLNRVAFGPRPGDVERVQRIGIERYVDEQLHPERIVDADLTTRLSVLTTLDLDSRELAQRYELPALAARRELKGTAAAPGPDGAQSPSPPLQAMDPVRQAANLPLVELAQQKVLRAVSSERQLEALLVDFWFNHFNVDARKGPERYMLTAYERDTIRPHVLGRFRDLLGATAKSPAMLFYLDNWMSADPDGPHMDRSRAPGRARGRRFGGAPGTSRPMPQRPNAPRGLNENYGRELMELHTLGVDGGYSQKDVTEVARVFTGWTIENPRQGGGFRFEPRLHDDGDKVVLGHTIKSGGEKEGEQVLDLLAAHPSTARFISTKLVRRFVSDTPPPALVERAAATFRQTGGDLRAVMTVILTSKEFLSPAAYGAKVKTPFEFVVSSARALGAEISDARPLVQSMQQLGMPLYQCQPPTGYKDTADAWVNTGALVARMNIGLALASGRLRGILLRDPPGPETILAGNISDTTRGTIAKAPSAPQAIALAIGSPEFQKR